MDSRAHPDAALKPMNDEIRALVAQHGDRDVSELAGEVEAIMVRYGVPEPSREGLIQWVDQLLAEARAR